MFGFNKDMIKRLGKKGAEGSPINMITAIIVVGVFAALVILAMFTVSKRVEDINHLTDSDITLASSRCQANLALLPDSNGICGDFFLLPAKEDKDGYFNCYYLIKEKILKYDDVNLADFSCDVNYAEESKWACNTKVTADEKKDKILVNMKTCEEWLGTTSA